jgi:hypothetical protein
VFVYDVTLNATNPEGRAMALSCKCGCGEPVKKGRMFVNKEHQLELMVNGGASEMNAMMPEEARAKGGEVAGKQSAESGRLHDAALKGAARSREIAEQFHRNRSSESA